MRVLSDCVSYYSGYGTLSSHFREGTDKIPSYFKGEKLHLRISQDLNLINNEFDSGAKENSRMHGLFHLGTYYLPTYTIHNNGPNHLVMAIL